MADQRTNLKVSIGGDIAEIKSALAQLRGELSKTKKEAASSNVSKLTSSVKGLIGTVAGLGGVALAFKAVFNATVEAEKAQAQLNAVLKSTGGTAGLTARELTKMADGLQAITTFDDEEIIGAQTILLQFDKIGKESFPRATKATLDLATRLGIDLSSAATILGKALQNPTTGLKGLRAAGVDLDETQKELVKSLNETGHAAEAQAIVLGELEKSVGGAAEAARNTLGGALEGLKNDFENLLEGDSGGEGIKGATQAINDLSKQMQSSETKQGFTDIINLIARLGQVAVATAGFLGQMYRQTSEGLNAVVGSGIYAYSEATLKEKIANFERLKANLKGATPALIAQWDKELAPLQARLQQIRAARITESINEPPPPPGAPSKSSSSGSDDEDKPTKSGTSAAKRVADARISEAKRAAEEIRKINEDEANDQAERDKAIAESLADAKIEILRRSGQGLDAANLEIEAKYAETIRKLQLKGDAEGEATIRKLMGLEKADAVLADLRDKLTAVTSNLRSETQFISDQVGVPNGITATAAEQQLQAVRKKTLDQLIKIRDAAQQAYNQTPSPETLAVLSEANSRILELGKSVDDFRDRAKDAAVTALTGFFNDLVSGAKSAKDAFLDMAAGFARAIADIIAQKLALKIVESIGLFHSGGVVGPGGTGGSGRRSVNPMLFAGAPRFHSGGMVGGLKPGEVPAILQTGERVLNRQETKRYGAGDRPSPGTRIVNVFDPAFVPDQMDSAAGERVIMNVIGRNPGKVKAMLS